MIRDTDCNKSLRFNSYYVCKTQQRPDQRNEVPLCQFENTGEPQISLITRIKEYIRQTVDLYLTVLIRVIRVISG